jgi:hypothetical protein
MVYTEGSVQQQLAQRQEQLCSSALTKHSRWMQLAPAFDSVSATVHHVRALCICAV